MPELKEVSETTIAPDESMKALPGGSLWWLPGGALLFCVSLTLYWPARHAGYFSDDFLFYFTSPPQHLYDYFFRIGSAIHAYRPFEAMILTEVQRHFQFETMPIHLLALCCHAGLVCLVIAAARNLRLGVAETAIAAAAMFLTQVGPPALLGNDTLSQSASGFFGCLSVFLLWRYAKPGSGRALWIAVSVLCYAVGVFFKETGLGFLLIAGLLAVHFAAREDQWTARIRKLLYFSVPYGLATAVYFLGRHLAGGELSTHGRYSMHIGLNVPRNLVSFGLAAFSPVSTVTSALALAEHHKAVVLLSVLAAGCVVLAVSAGTLHSNRKALVLALAIFAAASLFPTFLLSHVSELYAYNAIPFTALIFGIGLGSLWRRTEAVRMTAVICAAIFFAGQIFAIRQKAELMTANGRSAARMISAINRYLPSLPYGSTVDLVRAATGKPTYSVFVLNGFDVLDFGNIDLGAVLGRPDVRINIVEEPQARGLAPNDRLLLLGLDQNSTVERYSAGEPQHQSPH